MKQGIIGFHQDERRLGGGAALWTRTTRASSTTFDEQTLGLVPGGPPQPARQHSQLQEMRHGVSSSQRKGEHVKLVYGQYQTSAAINYR
jgi:hypothetical protein